MSKLLRQGLATALLLCLCACASDDPGGRSKEEDDAPKSKARTSSRASEQVADYEGKPKVIKAGPSAVPQAVSRGPARTLVYVTKESTKYLKLRRSERAKAKDRVVRSFVLTDNSAQAFRANFKQSHPNIPGGSVTSLNRKQVDTLLTQLEQIGFNRLPFINGAIGDPIPKKRAIHLDIGGQRRSVYRDQVRPDGTENSSKSIYFRCEIFLVNYFQTIQLGRD